MTDEAELLLRDDRAVLVLPTRRENGDTDQRSAELADVLGADLADALAEWARVCAAMSRTGSGAGSEVVSRRGRQLAGRVAVRLGGPVRYRDPASGHSRVVRPGRSPAFARPPHGRTVDPTPPWATGLTVAAFAAVFVVVAMLALASTLASETAGWVAILAAAVVSAGLAPSLWLGRTVPVVRWLVLGAVVGTAVSWLGVLVIAFS
ncbi:DUF2537 domain-containing protein [Saccharomonospora piscinae]|uniref:DUF2537 domain-containing protein n=1 Tax=Saccharomonospora piscinae TaxID=687388 RepID=UPI0011067FED|nr:DUF2537 domain-containing protein [Saccharomonospora piscinae]TLW91601.1 DUF2537 domain-containing protein [Saccharomonospora piscinae]